MNYKMNLVVDEARRILIEQPELKYYEAINQAKKILKKYPPGLQSKKGKGNTNQDDYITNGGIEQL